MKRAKKDARQGKSASMQAGEFVREEIHHIREGKHGARSAKQAIAIGLSKARRAGVKLAPGGKASTRKRAQRDLQKAGKKPSARRAKASEKALEQEGRSAASTKSLSRQARNAARRRPAGARKAAAKKAARTRKASR
jgi:hypothetical protein